MERRLEFGKGLLATLAIALALAFVMVPSLVLAADSDDEFTDAASDIAIEEDSHDDGATESEPSPEPAPEPASYFLRLIVSADDAALRDGDAVLGSHDGVHLLGFPDEDALADAEAYYAEAADWSGRDIPLAAADDEPLEGAPEPVTADDNAIALLGVASADDVPAAEGGHPLVALIDTGAPDDPSVVASATFAGDDPADNHGHATAMLEAMKSENPDIRILAIKALGDDGEGSASSVYAAIEYATEQGADIINLSLAGYATDENAAIAEAVARALENGITVIAAAGNGGYDAAYFTPANIAGVFAVGACDEDGNVLDSSNRGDCVSGYVVADSTSIAAARLTGWLSANEAVTDLASSPLLKLVGEVSFASGSEPVPADPHGFQASAKYTGTLTIHDFQSGSIPWLKGANANYVPGVKNGKGDEILYAYNNVAGFPFSGTTTSAGTTKSSIHSQYLRQLDITRGGIKKHRDVGLYFRGVWDTSSCQGFQWINPYGILSSAICEGTFGMNKEAYFCWANYEVRIRLNPNGGEDPYTWLNWVYIIRGIGISTDNIFGANSPSLITESSNNTPMPTREGYACTGFYTEPAGGTQMITASGSRTSDFTDTTFDWDTTLYAHWAKCPLITLDKQGGSGGADSLLAVPGGSVYIGSSVNAKTDLGLQSVTLSMPSKGSLRFNGYWTGTNGSGTQMIDKNGRKTSNLTGSSFAENTTLYAQWVEATDTWITTLDDTEGSGGPGAYYMTARYNNVTTEYVTIYQTGTRTFLQGDGKADFSISFSFADGKPNMGTPSIKLFRGYALDRADPWNSLVVDGSGKLTSLGKSYSEIVASKGGTQGQQNSGFRYGSRTNSYSEILFIYGKKAGYYSPSTKTEDTSIVSNGWGTLTREEIKCNLVARTKEMEEEGGFPVSYYKATAKMTATDRTAYAIWEGWPVNLDTQGGTDGGNTTLYEVFGEGLYADSAAKTALASVNVPRRTGYEFQGYYSGRDGAGLRIASADGSVNKAGLTDAFSNGEYRDGDAAWFTETAAGRTAYASWLPNTYKITLDPQGADTGRVGTTALYEVFEHEVYLTEQAADDADSSQAVTATENAIEIPHRSGYVFKGYYTQQEGGTRYIGRDGFRTQDFASNAFSEDGTLYAQWEEYSPILPLAGGIGENKPLLWGSTVAIVGAAGVVLFRALRPSRRKGAHIARQASRSNARSRAVSRPRTRHAR